MNITRRLARLTYTMSRFINVLFGGHENEMLSSRAWRTDNRLLIFILDTLFFLQPNHCKECFYAETKRLVAWAHVIEKYKENQNEKTDA